jgi:hypothetical protein
VKPASESDRLLKQFERDSVIACLAMAAIALAVERGRPDGAAGVLAGGALMAISYRAIKGGVDVVLAVASKAAARAGTGGTPEGGNGPAAEPALTPGRRAWLALKFIGRYALLAVGAYVMLACFRVHPVGLLAGATAPFVAAAVQLMRSSRASSGGGHP